MHLFSFNILLFPAEFLRESLSGRSLTEYPFHHFTFTVFVLDQLPQYFSPFTVL